MTLPDETLLEYIHRVICYFPVRRQVAEMLAPPHPMEMSYVVSPAEPTGHLLRHVI